MVEEELKKVKAAAWRYLDLAGLGDAVPKLDAMGYFMAPASKSHHLAEPGGLAAHSIHVTYWLVRLTRAGIVSWEDKRSPYRIGMLHDLVKCRCYIVDPTWDGYGPVRYYYQQPELTGHGEASALFAMSVLGVTLTPVETACIVHHMGAFCLDNRGLKEFDAALSVYPQEVIATHTADLLASRLEDRCKWEVILEGEA